MHVHVTQSAKSLSSVNEERELWGSELGMISHHLHDCLLESLQLGLSHCAWNPEETALNIVFLLLHDGRYVDKIEPDLRGNRKETSTLVLADILELPSSGYN